MCVCTVRPKNSWLAFHVHQLTLNLWQTFSLLRIWWNKWNFNCHLPVVLSGIINNVSFLFEAHCAKWTVPLLPYTRDHDKCCHRAHLPFDAELDYLSKINGCARDLSAQYTRTNSETAHAAHERKTRQKFKSKEKRLGMRCYLSRMRGTQIFECLRVLIFHRATQNSTTSSVQLALENSAKKSIRIKRCEEKD